MKKLKQYWQGQVTIRVTGTQIPRFLTVLSAREILYENAHYEGTSFVLSISARCYRDAVACAKKTGVRLRIVSKRGWPFFYFRHRRRKWTVFFVLPLIAAVFVLPRFVWTIEIDGLESISQSEMLLRLEQVGIFEGIAKKKVNTEKVKNELLLQYEDLSFASLHLEGTQLRVLVEEAVAAPEMVERDQACDVIASQSCVIYSIVTESGMPMVKAGDEVKAGQMLIQGQIVLTDDAGNETIMPAHAAGEVYGKRVWRAEETLKRSYEEKVWKENVSTGIGIRWGDEELELRWPFGISKQEAVIKEKMWSLPFGNVGSLYRLNYEGYTLQPAEYSDEELEVRLREKLQRRAAEELQQGQMIALEEEWQFEKTPSEMMAVLEMVIMENIGQEVKVK